MRSSKEIAEQLRVLDNSNWEAKKPLYDELRQARDAEEAERKAADEAAGRTNVHGSWEVREDGRLHCSYCGSLSVSEAIKLLQTPNVNYSGSDHKYGWPHKFYIGDCKFYNEHLVDATTAEEFNQFKELSWKFFGVDWTIQDGKLRYACPSTNSFYGHQRSGETQ